MKKINHKLDIVFCQECINEYKGEHGKRKKTIMTDIKSFNVDHVEGHIGKIKGIMVVVFRGSDGSADWIDNLNFLKTELDSSWFGQKCSVHNGFFSQFRRIRNVVFKMVKGNEKIIVIGHSLGAAIATLFAAYLARHLTKSEIGCVTFGSPRVGSPGFKKIYNKLVPFTRRYVYGEDMVCKVPPSLRWYYAHTGNKIRLGKTSWREIFLFIPRKIFGNPNDHEPERYLKALKEKYSTKKS